MPNPGYMGMGAVLTEPDGTRHTLSQATTSKGCSNEAELRALIAALEEGKARGAKAVLVYCDSRALVDQLGVQDNKLHVKPVARLVGVFDEARALLESFEQAAIAVDPASPQRPSRCAGPCGAGNAAQACSESVQGLSLHRRVNRRLQSTF